MCHTQRVHRALVVVFLLAAGCQSETDDASSSSAPEAGCSDDPRAMTFSAGMTLPGSQNKLSVQIAAADPAPPARGNNTWTVRVLDDNGGMVNDMMELEVDPFMPDHGHGTSVKAQVTIEPDGSATVTPLYLFMPGLWQITLGPHTPSSVDAAVFSFCIAG